MTGAALGAKRSQGDDSALIVGGRAIASNKLSLPHVPAANAKEQIAPSAMHPSASGVICDYNHSRDFLLLGNTRNHTLELHDQPDGLYFTLHLDPKIEAHRSIYQLVKAGTLDQCSFTFSCEPGDDEWTYLQNDPDGCTQLRTVKKATLYGITLTPQPAYGNDVTFVAARAMRSYCFGPPFRSRMSTAELRRVVERIGRDIDLRRRVERARSEIEFQNTLAACEEARQNGGFWEITSPGSAVRFEPFRPGDREALLALRVRQVGEEIQEEISQAITDQFID